MKKIFYLIAFIFVISSCQQDEITWKDDAKSPSVSGVEQAQVIPGHIQIKLKADAPALQVVKTRSGAVATGIEGIDLTNLDVRVTRIERVFPYAGKFEERHKEAGLHLWYDVYFDEKVPTRSAMEAYGDIPEIEVVSPVHEARLCDYQVVEEPLEPVRSMLQKSRTKATSGEPMPFNDPRLEEMWHYHNTGESVNGLSGALEGADIGVFEAWKTETGSPEVIVAVMDGGIQYNHPDLAANMWINEAELNGTAGVDDDGNGYVDDIYGWNFVTAKKVAAPVGDSIMGNGAITQYVHGTHCAGTISAVNGNGMGICGIAGGSGAGDGVRLMSCQIFHNDATTGESKAYADPNMYVYAADMGAVISSNSWTNGAYEEAAFLNSAMRSAIDYFIRYAGKDPSTREQNGPMNGGLVIFAAANSNSDAKEWPAAYSEVMTVASMAHNFKRASYSNFGTWIDITAPGGEQSYGDIYAVLSTSVDGTYAWLQGTSMACPHVSGCAALVLSKFQGKGYTPDELWDRLMNATHSIDAYNQKFQGLLGVGCIDVGLALTPPSAEVPDSSHLTVVDAYDDWAILEWTVKAAPDGPMSKYVISWSTESLEAPALTEANVSTKTVNVRYVPAGTVVRDTITGLELGQTYYFSLKAYDRWGGESKAAPQVSKTVIENQVPVLTPGWNGTVIVNEGTERTVSLKVDDPERQKIICKVEPALNWIEAENVGDTVVNFTVRPDYLVAGAYGLQITVADQYGKSASIHMPVEILYKEVAPRIIRSFERMELAKNGRRTTLNMTEYFSDPKGRTLIYEVENSSDAVATVQRYGDNLTIEPKIVGQTQILVRAKNEVGLSVSQRFTVEVILADDSELEKALSVYPNPVKKDLHITLQPSVRGEVTLRLYNAVGRMMKLEKVTIGDAGYTLDMGGMQAGTYVLVVENAAGSWKKNIIKI